METLTNRISIFLEALHTLESIINLFYQHQALYAAHPTKQTEELFLAIQDATIKRFEYCTDLIWKILQMYLEEMEKVNIENSSPRGIVRDVVTIKFLSETEGKEFMKMVDSRNKTCLIYQPAMAENIAQKIPEYYVLMKKIMDRMQDRIGKK